MSTIQTQVGPDVIGIGCRRCASSWLHAVLNEHPAVSKPRDGLHFFSNHYGRGVDWYTSHFADTGDETRRLEFSVSYAYPESCEEAAERIYRCFPEAKLFAVVRNPIDRALSDYLRSTRLLEIPAETSFEEAIERYPVYLERGLYGRILAPFFERFSQEQIAILFYEDLNDDPAAFLRRLFEFINVDPQFESLNLMRKEPQGGKVQNAGLNRALFRLKSGLDGLMTRISADGWQHFKARYVPVYSKLIAANTKPVTVSDATRRCLRDYFAPDIERFARLVQRDPSHWN